MWMQIIRWNGKSHMRRTFYPIQEEKETMIGTVVIELELSEEEAGYSLSTILQLYEFRMLHFQMYPRKANANAAHS